MKGWVVVLVCMLFVLAGCSSSPTGQLIKKPIKEGTQETYSQYIEPKELQSINDSKKTRIVDVRDVWKYNAGHVPKSINIPFGEISGARLQAEDISKEYRIIIYDDDGRLSEITFKILDQSGYTKVQILKDGYQNWVKNELTVVQSY